MDWVLDTDRLGLFTLLVAGIILVPGMDMLFVLANALTGGRRLGLAATAGVMLGGVLHTIFGTLAFAGMRLWLLQVSGPMLVLGAVYMGWVGFGLARSSIVVDRVAAAVARPVLRVMGQGVMTCVLNPKAWAFVLAVYPQFLVPGRAVWAQALAMGAITLLAQGAVYGGLALMAARGRDALTARPGVTIWLGRGAGCGLIAAAGYVLWQGGLA